MQQQDLHQLNTQESMDHLELGQTISRSRLIVVLSGVAIALIAFLFLIGLFRKEESHLVCDAKEPIAATTAPSTDDRLRELLARLEKLENQLKAAPLKEAPIIAAAPSIQDDPLSAIIAMAEEGENIAKSAPQETPKTAVKKEKTAVKQEKPVRAVGRIHTVQRGETLSQISLLYFGTPNRWRAIYEANRGRISNIHQLKVGTELVIPA